MLESLAIKRAAARVKEVKEDVILLTMRRDPDKIAIEFDAHV